MPSKMRNYQRMSYPSFMWAVVRYPLQCNKYYRLLLWKIGTQKKQGMLTEVVQRLINRAEKTLQETIEGLFT